MTSFEIIINCITAVGALATAGAFIYVIKGQKDTQKQIKILSQMATMARIQAGNTIYPKMKITLKHDVMWGVDIRVKNNSYPIEIYRIITNTGNRHCDTTINDRQRYIKVSQGETKTILPGEIVRHPIYTSNTAYIRLFVITPFEEAYEIRYSADGEQKPYQSEPIPILFSAKKHQPVAKKTTFTTKEYSISGAIPGTFEDNFPEIPRISKDDE